MARLPTFLLCLTAVCGLDVLPEHMRGGFVAQSNPELLPLAAPPHRPQPVYVTVPLDHFGPAGGKTMQIHYFLSNSSYKKGGPLFVNMAGEGSVHGCYTSEITAAFDGLSICPEHRFFGETSVPSNDSLKGHRTFWKS